MRTEVVILDGRNVWDLPTLAAESTDAADTSPNPSPRIGKLDTLPRCRRELVLLYRLARRGQLATQDMARMAYVVTMIARLIQDGDLASLEARIAALEARP